ncbi:glycosyltransferase involved in cell wall biosynthesis [Frigoribacterium sp. PhB160]|uniref:glycosyltransferase n=1 Tax=Frigoribacterium sp. PhB160 TaxID=2485192 RepID=UPI000FC1345F|nr:glycosyltransferase [Frigoribacterium sp. PhB160]ROS62223.1 glycosyltransferase involved in cell wall biosynthesis [Frigoribacterium sp. PhB160]
MTDAPHPTDPTGADQHADAPRLTVLIAADTFPPDVNGAANFAERLAVGLAGRGHDVHVLAPAPGRRHGTFHEEHAGTTLTVHRLYSTRWPLHDWLRFATPWRAQANAERVIARIEPDVVHIQSHIVIGRAVVRVANRLGIRAVATNHFMPENLLEHTGLPHALRATAVRWAWADASRTYHRVQAMTSPTQKAATFLEKAIGVRGVLAVSCGIDASHYTARADRPRDAKIVFVGRVTAEKQIDVLLRAMTKIDPAVGATLTIVGGGDLLKQLQQATIDLGLANRVTFVGYLSDAELRQTLTDSSVFAMPSIAELQSIASLEAMASGLPIVVADAMALPHLVDEGENGWLFRPGDADDLAEKLTRVLTADDETYLAMRRASLRMIEGHDIERTLNVFEALYRGEPVVPTTDVAPS